MYDIHFLVAFSYALRGKDPPDLDGILPESFLVGGLVAIFGMFPLILGF